MKQAVKVKRVRPTLRDLAIERVQVNELRAEVCYLKNSRDKLATTLQITEAVITAKDLDASVRDGVLAAKDRELSALEQDLREARCTRNLLGNDNRDLRLDLNELKTAVAAEREKHAELKAHPWRTLFLHIAKLAGF